jgi:hypothetical protein
MKHGSKLKTITASRTKPGGQVAKQSDDLGLQEGKVHASEEVGKNSRDVFVRRRGFLVSMYVW